MTDPTPKREPPLVASTADVNTSAKRPQRALITSFPVMLDACVLVNATIRDFALWAAHFALYRPVWTREILDEVRAALLRLNLPEPRVEYLLAQMQAAFPEALVEEYRHLVPVMTNDDDDRHVLAGAVTAKAQLIVTRNIRHFPFESLKPYRIEVITPDDFFCDLLDLDRERMTSVITMLSQTRKMPPKTIQELLEALVTNGCPAFAAATCDKLAEDNSENTYPGKRLRMIEQEQHRCSIWRNGMVHLIKYELKGYRPRSVYQRVEDEIKAVGPWCHIPESTWLVETELSTQQVAGRLAPLTIVGDTIFVSAFTEIGPVSV